MPLTAKQYCDALREAQGLVSIAARRLGVTRGAVQAAMNKHPSVRLARDDAKAKLVDLAEGKLYKRINDEDMTAIIFFLKTQAKDRGYIEKHEVEATVKGDIVINLLDLPELT